jgi:hypothetical protein
MLNNYSGFSIKLQEKKSIIPPLSPFFYPAFETVPWDQATAWQFKVLRKRITCVKINLKQP